MTQPAPQLTLSAPIPTPLSSPSHSLEYALPPLTPPPLSPPDSPVTPHSETPPPPPPTSPVVGFPLSSSPGGRDMWDGRKFEEGISQRLDGILFAKPNWTPKKVAKEEGKGK